jgi:hypothetical protein
VRVILLRIFNFLWKNCKTLNPKKTFVFRPITTENVLVVRVKGQNGRLEKFGVVLTDIEGSIEKTDCVNVTNI